MADPKRLIVKKELTEWLEGITVANGYQHEMAGKVFRGRTRFDEHDPLPALAIIEPFNPDREINDVGGGRLVSEDMILLIQGWVALDMDVTDPTDAADRLLADAKKRVAELMCEDLPPHQLKPWHNLYGLVSSVKVEPGVSRPPDEVSSFAYCYFRVAFGFVEKLDDPYGV